MLVAIGQEADIEATTVESDVTASNCQLAGISVEGGQ